MPVKGSVLDLLKLFSSLDEQIHMKCYYKTGTWGYGLVINFGKPPFSLHQILPHQKIICCIDQIYS
jgi:hypothetical protein